MQLFGGARREAGQVSGCRTGGAGRTVLRSRKQKMNDEKMRELVMYWQDVTLDDEAAARLAKQSLAVGKALRRVAGGSMFDTEPAHFDRALIAMSGRDDV
jgi:hypothetical protein